ncbi:MAG: hypothetical protein WCI11_20345 [Candidatus Methylumidiphilus sp.]
MTLKTTLGLIPPSSGKNPALVVILSIIPGAGQIYLGQKMKGVILLVISLFLPIFIVLSPLSIIDTMVLYKRIKRGNTITQWEFFWNRKVGSREVIWDISDIIKRGRTEQPIGMERRLIDNSKSASQLMRNIMVRREWSCSYTVEHEHSQTTVNTKSIQLKDGVTIGRSVEDALHNRFSYTHDSRHILEENVQITVEPFKKVQIVFSWKNILEVGTIILQNQSGETIELPFSIIIGLTFDQAQLDE